ncbi:MAG: type I methionyl aminopeptidase [bacterium]|nr:type I methionyl aminopeptidase [bacterium]
MVVLKTPGELDLMDEANRIVHRVLDGIAERTGPGVTTGELDRWAEATIREAGGVPAFLNYKGFPATLCTALNDVIVHGIPDDRPLEEGDILGIDCGVLYKGYYGDAARTYDVGKVAEQAVRLMRITQEALDLAVDKMQPGGRLSDIGSVVQRHVERNRFSVVREFVGHGVGTTLHEEPQVPNFGRPGKGMRLKPGLVLAIEPMVNAGNKAVQVGPDGWTARTRDGSLSAHYEYSVAVTTIGPRILGRSSRYLEKPVEYPTAVAV